MERPKALAQSFLLVSLGIVVTGLVIAARTGPVQQADQKTDLERALGKWSSTERFEEESRITVAIRRKGTAMYGWAVLLGQTRKSDNRATLALSFPDVRWDGRRFLFTTILPEDEGTIGWELRVATPTTAILKALTENGKPFDEELKWDMTKWRIGSSPLGHNGIPPHQATPRIRARVKKPIDMFPRAGAWMLEPLLR